MEVPVKLLIAPASPAGADIMSAVELAAVLAVAVVVASVISLEVGISVALLELGLGVIAGNLFHQRCARVRASRMIV
jgi:hypothetical protein